MRPGQTQASNTIFFVDGFSTADSYLPIVFGTPFLKKKNLFLPLHVGKRTRGIRSKRGKRNKFLSLHIAICVVRGRKLSKLEV